MERGVRVGAPHGLLVSRDDVVVVVSGAVVAHGGLCRDLFDELRPDGDDGRVSHAGAGCHAAQLDRGDGFPYIAACCLGNGVCHVLRYVISDAVLLADHAERPLDGRHDVLRGDALELEDRAAGDDGVVDVEVGVLGGGGDHRDVAALEVFEQALLLFLVEVLDLVEVEKDAVGRSERAYVRHHVLDVGDAGGGGVEPVQFLAGLLGDDVREGRLADARGAVEDEVRDVPRLHDVAQRHAVAEQVALADHLVEGARADAVRQRSGHKGSPSFQLLIHYIYPLFIAQPGV